MAKNSEGKVIKITLVKSVIGAPKPQKATIRALGIHRVNQTVDHKDSPVLRGMLTKVIHLIKVEE